MHTGASKMGFSVDELRAIGRAIPAPEEEELAGLAALVETARTKALNGGILVKERLALASQRIPDWRTALQRKAAPPSQDLPEVENDILPDRQPAEAYPDETQEFERFQAKREPDRAKELQQVVNLDWMSEPAGSETTLKLQPQEFLFPGIEPQETLELAPASAQPTAADPSRGLEALRDLSRARHANGLDRIEQGDAEGVADLIEAMWIDPRLASSAHRLALDILPLHPSPSVAAQHRRSLKKLGKALIRADRERQRPPRLWDLHRPAALSPDAAAAIHAAFSQNERIETALIVRRRTKLWPELPAFVVILRDCDSWLGGHAENDFARDSELLTTVEKIGAFGTACVLYPTTMLEHLIARRISRTPGVWFFQREA